MAPSSSSQQNQNPNNNNPTPKDRLHDNLRVFIRCRPVLPTDKTAVTDRDSTFNLVRIIDRKLVVVLDPEKVWREQQQHMANMAGQNHHNNGLYHHDGDSDHHHHDAPSEPHHHHYDYAANPPPNSVASSSSSYHPHQRLLSKHHQHDILRQNRSREKRYAFDCAFDASTTQEEVFKKCVEPLLDSVLDGFNASCFAYGPTGSGKTYTMTGPEHSPGIMFRALQGIFHRIQSAQQQQEESSGGASFDYRIVLSYLEVYNENIRDLLQPSDEYLELREDNDRMHVVGLTEVEIKSMNQTMALLRKGNGNRIQEETSHNKESSRSHAVLQIVVEKRNRVKDVQEEVQIGKLSLIDLAGSERAAVSNNRGIRLREGANINRSLLALGNCINALGHRNNRGGYIPYRDSKLTRLLKDSLGGNCRTSMVSCISPTNYEDTINTLKYANRAKNIKMTVTRNVTNVNHHIVHYTSIIGELKNEISNLKQKLVATNKQLNFQKRQASEANLNNATNKKQTMGAAAAASNGQLDPEFERLTQELVVNFEEMMQARKSVAELEALELANKIQINNLQLEVANTRESLSKSPAASRRSSILEMTVSKRRKEIDDLVQNMRRNSRMKAEFQEKYEQLEQLAITLKEQLKQAASDNRQKQEWLTQLFRLHLLELQNTDLHSFQNKQQDLMREKDLVLKNLRAQIQVRDNVIQKQREQLSQYQHVDMDMPPSFIDASEFEGLTTHFEENDMLAAELAEAGAAATADDSDSVITGGTSSVPTSRGGRLAGGMGSRESSTSMASSANGAVLRSPAELGSRHSLFRGNHSAGEGTSTDDMVALSHNHHEEADTISDALQSGGLPNPITINGVASNGFRHRRYPTYNGNSDAHGTPNKHRVHSRLSEKSSTPSPKRKRSLMYKRTKPFSTPPPQRRHSQQPYSSATPKRDARANQQGASKKTKPKQSTKRIHRRRANRQKLLSKIYGHSPYANKKSPGRKSPAKKSPSKRRSKERQRSPGQELFTKKNGNDGHHPADLGSPPAARFDLHQARLRKQRQRAAHRPSTLASSFHSDDFVLQPQRSESPDHSKSRKRSNGGMISSSLDSATAEKESRFPSLNARRRLQSIPASQSYEHHFKRKLRMLEKQRQALHHTP